MSGIADGFAAAYDAGNAPLFGNTDALDPWLWLLVVVLLAFIWVRVLHYMGRVRLPGVE
jgi:hypothetical protein